MTAAAVKRLAGKRDDTLEVKHAAVCTHIRVVCDFTAGAEPVPLDLLFFSPPFSYLGEVSKWHQEGGENGAGALERSLPNNQ